MLKDFPTEVPHLALGEIRQLQGKLPATSEAILDALARLLPLLGDELVPVWQSAPLPSQPVDLVSFQDKGGAPLVAVVCESGLLWVAPAEAPEDAVTLQLPEVGTVSRRVRNLLASHTLRPFGEWTELVVTVVALGEGSDAEPVFEIYRALVRHDGRRVILEPAVEDAPGVAEGSRPASGGDWLPLPLPPRYGYLTDPRLVFSGGVDPFFPTESLAAMEEEETPENLRIVGPGAREVVVEGHLRLRVGAGAGPEGAADLLLGHAARAGAVVPGPAGEIRTVLAQEGRRLAGIALGREGVTWGAGGAEWEQEFPFQPLAVDSLILGPAPPGGKARARDREEVPWPDLVVAQDDRRVLRLACLRAATLHELWNRLLESLGTKETLASALGWVEWCRKALEAMVEQGIPGPASRRRTLVFLAVDRALAATSEELEAVRKGLRHLASHEVEAPLLLPAAWRLRDALREWEDGGGEGPAAVPELTWTFYEKVPFSVQELFDSHLRTGRGLGLKGKNPSYDELLANSTNVVLSYVDTKDPLRDVGIKVMQALGPYATASIESPGEARRYRHLVPLELGGDPRVVTVGARALHLYRLVRQQTEEQEVKLEAVEQASTALGELFTAQFAVLLGSRSGPALLLGSLQGELALWQPRLALDKTEGEALRRFPTGGVLSAAVPLPPAPGETLPTRALVARNQGDKVELLRVGVSPRGFPMIEARGELPTARVLSLALSREEGKDQVLVGDGEELVLLRGELGGAHLGFVKTAHFPMGSAIRALSVLPGKEGGELLLAGTREGLVHGLLRGGPVSPWQRSRWIFQVQRGISGTLAGDFRHGLFGAISTQGGVFLLDREGRAVFEYSPHDPVEAGLLVTVGKQLCLVVGAQSGVLTVLHATGKRASKLREAREKARALFQELPSDPPPNEARELGWLCTRLEQGGDPHQLYGEVRFHRSREALVELVGEEPERLKERVKEWVERLPLQDLADFLQRLPQGAAGGWFLHTWERLLPGSPAALLPEEGRLEAEGRLLYELLRLGRPAGREIPVEQFRSLEGILRESAWMNALVAQYAVAVVGGGVGRGTALLGPLLDTLALFPLGVARAAARIVGASRQLTPHARALEAVVTLGDATSRRAHAQEVRAALRHLAGALEPWKSDGGGAGLLARFARFIADPELDRAEQGPSPWGRLVAMLEEAQKVRDHPSLGRLLFTRMASWLPAGRPGPYARLSEEQEWLLHVQERAALLPSLDEEAAQEEERVLTAADRTWRDLYEALLEPGRELMQRLSREAAEQLRGQVRLHVRLKAARHGPQQRVSLEIEVEPEALRPVETVRYRLDLGGQEGLGSLGSPLSQEADVFTLQGRQPAQPRLWVFEGRLAPEQRQVRVETTLRRAGGGEHRDEFTLSLPAPPGTASPGRAPFPEALPARAAELVQELRALRRGCRIVLLDEDLGREGLAGSLLGPGVRAVDLDAVTRELGSGRSYPELLTFEALLGALRGEEARASAGTRKRGLGPGDLILVSHGDDLWDRLFSDPSLRGVRDRFLTFLATYDKKPALLFLAGSHLRSGFRREPGLSLMAAYRLNPEEEPEILGEEISWLTAETAKVSSERLGVTALERLGGDLRLGLLFRRLVRGQELTAGVVQETITGLLQVSSGLEILQRDLAGLSAEALHLLVVAACSRTTLRFKEAEVGLIAAETVQASGPSGSQKSGKKLLEPGQILDTRICKALDSDRLARERTFQVRGYRAAAPTTLLSGVEHLALFLGRSSEIGELARLLEEIGAVKEIHGIVCAVPPYGWWIEDAVARRRLPPAEIYQMLSGGLSPLAAWPLHFFSDLTPEKIRQVAPQVDAAQATMLQQLGTVWRSTREQRHYPENLLLRGLQTLTGQAAEWVAGSGRGAGHLPTWPGQERDFLIGLGETGWGGGKPYYFLLRGEPEGNDGVALSSLVDALQAPPAETRGGEGEGTEGPILLLLARPGATPARLERGDSSAPGATTVVELPESQLRDAAIHPRWAQAFWGLVRARAGLRALAPFRTEGALPPGSPVFAGREEEIKHILRQLRERSFLIVGSRQIGKTSLLNELRRRIQREKPDITCFYMDLQGLEKGSEITSRRLEGSAPAGDPEGLTGFDVFRHLADQARAGGRHPVFLLNEIDKVLGKDPDFLASLRGLHDSSNAHFVMTGYTQAAAACDDPQSPFYHWMASPDRRKYLALGELSHRAAEKIIGILEAEPLALSWASPREKTEGVQLILDRSYRIPYLVQTICLGLVERLEERQDYRLTLEDVAAVVNDHDVAAWQHVEKVDLAYSLPALGEKELARTLARLMLYTAMQNLYFKGSPAPIHDPHLAQREPKSLHFSQDLVRKWLPEPLKRLLVRNEYEEAYRLINELDIERALSALSLTFVLSYDPAAGRYYFPGHLYPRELQRHLRPGELIEDHIVELVLRFANFLSTTYRTLPSSRMEGRAP